MKEAGPALIWCPFENDSSARTVATQLVEEGLVACANILPPMTSVFQWQGSTSTATETGVLFKTDARLLDAAVARLGVLHPYETPAIVGWRADSAPPATRDWLGGLVEEDRGP